MSERNPEWETNNTPRRVNAINLDDCDDPYLCWVFDLRNPYEKRKPCIVSQSFKASRP